MGSVRDEMISTEPIVRLNSEDFSRSGKTWLLGIQSSYGSYVSLIKYTDGYIRLVTKAMFLSVQLWFSLLFENPQGIMEPHVTNGLHITTDTTGEQNAMNNLDQQNGHENDNL